MSLRAITCPDCQVEGRFSGVQRWDGTSPDSTDYAVAWQCPKCQKAFLDVCPLGPLVPSDALCLNCGTAYPSTDTAAACPACQLTRSAVAELLRLPADLPADAVGAAGALCQSGLLRVGMGLINRALMVHPGHVESWQLKLQFLDHLALHEQAIAMLAGATEHGAPADLLIDFGVALQNRGLDAVAAKAYRRCREVDPIGAWVGVSYANEGTVARRIGDQTLAEELYRRAVAVDPDRATNHYNYASLLLDLGRWSEAALAAETGIPTAAEQPELRQMLHEMTAHAHLGLQDGATAMRCIDAGLAIAPPRARLFVLRGRALLFLNRSDEAVSSFGRALELDPTNAEARSFLAKLAGVTTSPPSMDRWSIKL